ncbi:hypothetical protein ACW95P_03930 [Candidatus Mycoplasma pogonae]
MLEELKYNKELIISKNSLFNSHINNIGKISALTSIIFAPLASSLFFIGTTLSSLIIAKNFNESKTQEEIQKLDFYIDELKKIQDDVELLNGEKQEEKLRIVISKFIESLKKNVTSFRTDIDINDFKKENNKYFSNYRGSVY